VSDRRVSSLELFFDLVFVFTVTQLTAVLVDRPDLRGLAQVVVTLGIVFWMYGGYAWLTNAIAVDRPQHRFLLLGGMAGFLTLALAIPGAFAGSGATFGLAYLFIVLLHLALFTHATSQRSARAIVALAPYNVVSALLVLAGGVRGGDVQWVLWAAAVALEWCTPLLAGVAGFDVARRHFVERHGLVVIVALGESVVAVGIGASALPVDAGLVAVAVLGLALSACLWWTYFGDEARVERAMEAAPPQRVPEIAIVGFGYWHWLMLLAVIAVAAGLKKTTGHPTHALDVEVAAFLGGGVALFLVADVLFRRTLGLRTPDRLRVAAAAAAPVTIALGALVAAVAQLAALVLILATALLAEQRIERRRRRVLTATSADPEEADDGDEERQRGVAR
jgi:low temperature requirement protein LtrA